MGAVPARAVRAARPRANLEPAAAAAEELADEEAPALGGHQPDAAPFGSTDEFLPVCGVIGLGRLLADGDHPYSLTSAGSPATRAGGCERPSRSRSNASAMWTSPRCSPRCSGERADRTAIAALPSPPCASRGSSPPGSGRDVRRAPRPRHGGAWRTPTSVAATRSGRCGRRSATPERRDRGPARGGQAAVRAPARQLRSRCPLDRARTCASAGWHGSTRTGCRGCRGLPQR